MKKIKELLLVESFGELFSPAKIKELCIHYKEIILYIVFGVVTTVVNWIVYALAVKAFNVDLSAFSTDGVIGLLFTDRAAAAPFFEANKAQLTALFGANIIAWVAGVTVAFITNKIWVFESKAKSPAAVLSELVKFVAARLLTGVIEWFGLPLAIVCGMNQTLFGVEGFFAKVIISVIVIVLNYVFSKLIVFKKSKGTKNKTE